MCIFSENVGIQRLRDLLVGIEDEIPLDATLDELGVDSQAMQQIHSVLTMEFNVDPKTIPIVSLGSKKIKELLPK